jgi:hypothetical protein
MLNQIMIYSKLILENGNTFLARKVYMCHLTGYVWLQYVWFSLG